MSGASDPEVVGVLYSYFGGLDRTILTLFMCISGGVSWEVAVGALMQVHVAYGLLFVLFVAGMMLAALNIIAGIFVNDAIEMAQQDREVMRQAQVVKREEMQKELTDLFMESDQDKSGTLTVQEFVQAFEHPDVEARFRLLGVELSDTKKIFHLLDINEDDELGIGEFVAMIGRARMLTQPLDLQSFMQQNKQIEQGFRRNLLHMSEDLDKLTGATGQVRRGDPVTVALPSNFDLQVSCWESAGHLSIWWSWFSSMFFAQAKTPEQNHGRKTARHRSIVCRFHEMARFLLWGGMAHEAHVLARGTESASRARGLQREVLLTPLPSPPLPIFGAFHPSSNMSPQALSSGVGPFPGGSESALCSPPQMRVAVSCLP